MSDKQEIRALEAKLAQLLKSKSMDVDLIEALEWRIGWIMAGRPTEG